MNKSMLPVDLRLLPSSLLFAAYSPSALMIQLGTIRYRSACSCGAHGGYGLVAVIHLKCNGAVIRKANHVHFRAFFS